MKKSKIMKRKLFCKLILICSFLSPLPKTPDVTATYPERPVAGFLPAVRLGRRELPRYSPASRSLGRSPNTVKIAPPDPRRINNTRYWWSKVITHPFILFITESIRSSTVSNKSSKFVQAISATYICTTDPGSPKWLSGCQNKESVH